MATVSTPVTNGGNRGQDAIGSAASATIGPDGTIYIGANNSNFYAISPTGQLVWLFEAEREIGGIWSTAALSADNRTLYFGANKGGLYALNRVDGSLRDLRAISRRTCRPYQRETLQMLSWARECAFRCG